MPDTETSNLDDKEPLTSTEKNEEPPNFVRKESISTAINNSQELTRRDSVTSIYSI